MSITIDAISAVSDRSLLNVNPPLLWRPPIVSPAHTPHKRRVTFGKRRGAVFCEQAQSPQYMKNTIVLLAILALANGSSFADEKKPAAQKAETCEKGLPPGKYSEKSLYRLDATWTSDAGKELKLSALQGRPQVMALFFSNCQHSCPFIVADMKGVEKALPKSVRSGVDFALVSIDPARDSEEALRAFRAKHELNPKHWRLLRGSPEAVHELAEKTGFNYYPGSTTQFAHSLLIFVLNNSGEIIFKQSGIGNDRKELVATLTRIASKK